MTQTRWKGAAGAAGAVVIALAGAWFGFDLGDGGSGDSPGEVDPDWRHATCAVDSLPDEADEVIDDILEDRPLAYPAHDGKRFANYEGRLPKEPSGYYREYTVETPGLDHRGARRIVVGGGSEHDPDYWYWTDDHYASFCAIPDAEQ